jgi:hypothetical protein
MEPDGYVNLKLYTGWKLFRNSWTEVYVWRLMKNVS